MFHIKLARLRIILSWKGASGKLKLVHFSYKAFRIVWSWVVLYHILCYVLDEDVSPWD